MEALLASLWPVFNALVIMTLVMSVYSIIGVSFYRDKSEVIKKENEDRKQCHDSLSDMSPWIQRFRTFSSALFTMFQVVAAHDI